MDPGQRQHSGNGNSSGNTSGNRRWDSLDVARGVAIAAMISYHFSWDLSFLRLVGTDVVGDPAWQWYARAIAGSFLILVGISLSLAHARALRSGPFLRRLTKVGVAALAITAATLIAFPDSYIFFGILHCIALSSVLALPFLRTPAVVTILAAVACLAAPWFLTDPGLDHPLLDWLGLGAREPRTNDYVPIFPWFGLVLIGIVIGRSLLARGATSPLARWRASSAISRTPAWAGRWSLPIYLIHQPLLLALLYGVLQITGPLAPPATGFVQQCEIECGAGGGTAKTCRSLCACVAGDLRESELWPRIVGARTTPADQIRISEAVQQCLRAPPSD